MAARPEWAVKRELAISAMNITRRNFTKTTFAAAILAGLGERCAFASLPTIDYFIAPASKGGSMSNTGTSIGSPWTIAALWSKSTTYAGKVIAFMPGTASDYSADCAAAVANWVNYVNGGGGPVNINPALSPFLPIQGAASSASPTTVCCCNASGNYAPRTAILDFHPIVGKRGVSSYVTNVAILNATQISLTLNAPSSNSNGTPVNPFRVGDVLSFYQITGMTGLNGQTGTVAAIGGSAGAWTATVTLSVNPNTLGTWSSGNFQFAYCNYPNVPNGFGFSSAIGWAENQQVNAQFTGGAGGVRAENNILLDGLVINGIWGYPVFFHDPVFYNMTGITVQNCEFSDCSGPENQNAGGPFFENLGGTMNTLSGSSNNGTGLFIYNNLIHDMGYGIRSANGNFDMAGLWVWQSKNHTARYNTVYQCGNCVYFKSGPQGSWQFDHNFLECDPLYPYSCFDDGQLADSGLATPLTWLFEHNILMPHGANGPAFYGHMADVGSNDTYIGTFRFNTIYSSEAGSAGFYSENGAPAGYLLPSPGNVTAYCNIYDLARNGALNNEFLDFAACALSQSGSGSHPFTTLAVLASDYNLFDGTGATLITAISPYSSAGNQFTPNGQMTISAWRSATTFDAHSGNGSPTYASSLSALSYANPNGFKLQSSSLGSATGALPGSTDGTVGGGATDMGAYGGGTTQVGANFTSVLTPGTTLTPGIRVTSGVSIK